MPSFSARTRPSVPIRKSAGSPSQTVAKAHVCSSRLRLRLCLWHYLRLLLRKRFAKHLGCHRTFHGSGTNAFMIRVSRPGMILERFSHSALRPWDTHYSTLIGFIGMVRGSTGLLALRYCRVVFE